MFAPLRLKLSLISLILLCAALVTLPAMAQKRLFSNDTLINESKRLALSLQKKAVTTPRPATAMDWKARQAMKTNLREALSYFKIAAGKSDASQTWTNLARVWLNIKTRSYRERSDFPQKASAAAYRGFVHAQNNQEEADSLFILGKALERRSMWRTAMAAYKASLIRNPSETVAATYQDLKNRKGFRITDYNVDSDALSPRACIQFSETLDKEEKDYAKYIRMEGNRPATVTAENKQLCIDGLEHGRRYRITVRAGIPNYLAEKLEKTSDLSIYVKDRTPALRFTGKNYVLPRTGQQGIPLISVNLDKADIDLYRVGDRGLSQTFIKPNYDKKLFGRQLDRDGFNKIKDGLGEHIWHKSLIIHKVLNKDTQTAVPVNDAITNLKPGVYVLRATVPNKNYESWDTLATQWFIISDLGLTAFSGDDGIHAFVRSIGTALPQKGVEIRLMAKNNEILGTATTDKNGYARFPAGLARGEGGQRPGLLTARLNTLDYAFLNMSSAAFDLSDRGVSGRKAAGAIDSYLFTERGVYRPGSTVHMVAIARDQKSQALQNMPFTLVIERPDGVEYKRTLLKDKGLGGHSHDIDLPTSVQTGSWRLKLFSNVKEDPVAETRFLVEDFEPEKLKLVLKPLQKQVQPEQKLTIDVEGTYLYGAPAANMALEAEVSLSKAPSAPANFKGYHFGMANAKFSTTRKTIANLPQTNKEGKALVQIDLPKIANTTALLQAKVIMRLRETSGRTIERNVTLPVAPKNIALGIRPLFSGTLGEGENARFHVAAMGTNGKATNYKGLHWELSKIDKSYQWYSRAGNWNYQPIIKTRRIANGTFDVLKNKPALVEAKIDWGSYRLDVYAKGNESITASYNFSAGWYQENTDGDTPDLLEIGLDKKSYNIGDTVSVRIKPQSAGKALVTILNGGLIDKKLVDIPAKGGTVSFTVTEKWGAGAYVAASFYRPMNVASKRMPSRSVGIEWATIGKQQRSLNLTLDTAKILPSNSKLSIPVKITNAKPGEKVYIVASAVDVGILNLTRYKAPAPEDYFYAKRQLGVEMRDLYGHLIDGMQSVKGKLRSGGDGGAEASFGITGSPPAQKPLARFSGIKEVGADGSLNIEFDIPDFAGTVKVMTVAWSKTRVGHSQNNVIIRDKVVMTATTPKFMTVGDQSRIHMDLANMDGAEGAYTLTLVSGGAVLFDGQKVFSQQVTLAKGARKSWDIPVQAALKGTGFIVAELAGPEGYSQKRSYEFAVNIPHPDITTQSIHTVAAGGQLAISKDLLVNLAPGSGDITIAVAPSYLPNIPGLLMSLDRYPYGCSEQLTSRALPLLYLSSVAEQIGMKNHKKLEIRQRVQKAIDKILTRQDSEGAFGLWSPRNGGLWLTAYVTDFFTRAREKGYTIPQRAFTLALDKLSNTISYSATVKNGGENLAYALYVLARNKRARIGDLRYYVDDKLAKFSTPMALGQLGAALALYGDNTRAKAAYYMAASRIRSKSLTINRYNNFGSNLRDSAAMITLISETGVGKEYLHDLSNIMGQGQDETSSTTTQENSWLLLAANALFAQNSDMSLKVNGQNQTGSLFTKISARRLLDGDYIIENTGKSSARVTVTVTGTPVSAEPAIKKGLEIERNFYTLEGTERDLSSVKQNERFVVVLKVHEAKGLPAELMVADYIPAGFEIENPRLVSSSNTAQFSWLEKSSLIPVHSEFRNSRFTAAFTLSTSRKARTLVMAYMVRAVSPGAYNLPPAIAEDMYRPDRIARTDAGTMKVN